MNLRREFRLLNRVDIIIDDADFWSWTKCILHYAIQVYGSQGVLCGGLNENGSHKLIGNGIIGEWFFGVDLALKGVCPPVQIQLISLDLVIKRCGVSSSKVSTMSYGGQQRGAAKACSVWGASETL